MDPNRKKDNPFFDPDYLDENERTEEKSLEELALEMTKNGSLSILGGAPTNYRARNTIMTTDFIDTHRAVEQERLDREARESERDARLRINGVRMPLHIAEVSRVDASDFSNPLDISYRTDLHHSDGLDWDASRNWSCSFCGVDTKEHSWSTSNASRDAGIAVPPHCTLYVLIRRVAQDFFPETRVVLDTERSHLHNPRFVKLVFDQVDEQGAFMTTTWLNMVYERPKETSSAVSRAMKIETQLQRIAAHTWSCAKTHKLCKAAAQSGPIPAKRVLDLAQAKAGLVRLVEASGISKPYVALSHCWGPPSRHPLMTTRATLKAHMTGIPLVNLTKTFRDAIRVCVFMKIQYIWIDCLCIVQDDGYAASPKLNHQNRLYANPS